MRAYLLTCLGFLFLASCSSTSGFLDTVLPDRYGIGTSKIDGKMKSRGSTRAGTPPGGGGPESMFGEEPGSSTTDTLGAYSESGISVWFEWDIPSVSAEKVSIAGMRERFVEDYRAYREPEPSGSFLSVTKTAHIDEVTGEISESWDFGLNEALMSGLAGLLSLLGYKFMRDRKAKGEE